jgi:DNA-binding transcriptional MocR family regulator
MARTLDGSSDDRGREPKYRRIVKDLTAAIRSGVYAAGDPLPAQRALSESYGVTLMTLRQALQVLESEGRGVALLSYPQTSPTACRICAASRTR